MRKLLSAFLAMICLIAVVAAVYGALFVAGSWMHVGVEVLVALISGFGSYVLSRPRARRGEDDAAMRR